MKEVLYDFCGYNKYLFLKINNFTHILGLENPLFYLSNIFNIENFAIFYFILALVGFSWIRYHKKSSKSKSKFFDFMIKLGINYAIFGLSYAALKFSINMERPFCSLTGEEFYSIADITKERCLSSFPSSHIGLVMMIVLNFWPHICKQCKFGLIGLLCLVGLSRISLAMHYPSDIIYSLAITYIIYRFSLVIYRLFEKNLIQYFKDRLINLL